MYFQGVAQNLKSEEFGFEAQKYNREMIIVAPQLSDWNETSANQTIALTEYFLANYNIDRSKVYANGLSGGGLINWSFMQENLIDEVSLVLAPVADGGRTAVSIFEKADFLPDRKPAAFTLKAVD
ncbi:MAG: dihydrofolate reductase family protein [Acutalibacteraceae bacterium]